jgi:hypothetical protein
MSLIFTSTQSPLQALRFGAGTADRVRYGVLPGETVTNTGLPRTIIMWVRVNTWTASRRFWTWGVTSPIFRCQINTTNGEIQIQTARATTANLRITTAGQAPLTGWMYFAAVLQDLVTTATAIRMYYGTMNNPATEALYTTTTDGAGVITPIANAQWTLANDAAATPAVAMLGDVAFFGVYGHAMTLQEIREMQYDPTSRGDCRIFSSPGWGGRGSVLSYAHHWRTVGTLVGGIPIADAPPLAIPWRPQRRLVRKHGASGIMTPLTLGGTFGVAELVGGARQLAIKKTLGAIQSSAAVQVSRIGKLLTATEGPAGVLAALKLVTVAPTGAVTPGPGAVSRRAGKPVTGAETPGAGTVARRMGKLLVGAETPGPGAVARQAGKALTGAEAPGPGVVARRAGKPLAGGATPAGVLATLKASLVALVGTVPSAGVLAKAARSAVAGAIAPGPGALLRRAARVLFGALTPGPGTLLRQTRAGKAGAITPGPGVLASLKASLVALTGTVTSAGIVGRQVRVLKTGAVTPTGALTAFRRVLQALAGALTPGGVVTKQARTGKAGAVTPGGVLATLKASLVALTGATTPGGTVARQARATKTGAITPAGTVALRIARALLGTVTSAGAVARRVGKVLLGAITPTGVVTSRKVVLATVAGTVGSAGAVVRRAGKAVLGSLIPAGVVVKRAQKLAGGSIAPAATTSLQTRRKGLGGALVPTGLLARLRAIRLSLVGVLAPTGGLGAAKNVAKLVRAFLYELFSVVPAVDARTQVTPPVLPETIDVAPGVEARSEVEL